MSTVRYPRSLVFADHSLAVFTATSRLDGDHEQHSHDFVEVAVVRSGSARHVTVSGTEPLGPGSVVLVRPGSWHGYVGCADLVVTNCCFGTELVSRELAWLRSVQGVDRLLWSSPGGVLLGTLEAQPLAAVGTALEGLAAALAGPPASRGVEAVGWLLVVLAQLAPLAGAAPDRAVAPPVVEALQLLDADPAHPWRVDDLAARVLVGPAHLTRLFTAHVGVSPMAYLSRLRAERAAVLLGESTAPVATVGAAVGWGDPNYFARVFRSHYGMSPRDYRSRRGPVLTAADHPTP